MAPPIVVGLGEILWDLLPGGRVLGGAPANFVHHAHALGARGVIVSAVGSDGLGREILALLESAGLDTGYVSVDGDHPTGTVSVTLTPAGTPRFTIHDDVAWDHQQVTPSLGELARGAAAVCFGTLAQRSPKTAAMIRGFLDATQDGTLRVFDINLRQQFYSREVILQSLKRTHVLKLNDEELAVLRGLLRLPEGEAEALRTLLERFRLSVVALTKGSEGSLLLTPDACSQLKPDPVSLVDSVGAGDAFTAGVVVGLLKGLPLERIHRHASAIASFVCTQPGATPPLPVAMSRFPAS